jgi:anti-sigma factor RsiW
VNANHLLDPTIGAMADGELSAADKAEAEAHLATCAICARRALAASQLKMATRQAADHYRPSRESLARLTATVQQKAKPRTAGNRWRSWAALASAAVLVAGIALGGWRLLYQSNGLAAEVLDQHLAVLSNGTPPEVLSSDRHTVKPWFEGKLPFSFNLPDTLPADTVLMGADLAYFEGRPVAQLLFTIHGHRTSVFVSQPGVLGGLSRIQARSGFHFIEAKAGGVEILGVGDVAAPDLDGLVEALAAAQ